jgi:fructokinase
VIVVCGEALIDMIPESRDGERAFVPRPGGSPMNVAVGLARLGLPVAFLGRTSTDAFGRWLRHHLETNHVDLRFLVFGEEPTPLAFVTVAERGQAEYVFRWEGTADRNLRTADLPDPLPGYVEALHVGSVALALEPAASTIAELVQRSHGRQVISLDPNVRPDLVEDVAAYRQRLEQSIAAADIVKVSDEDLAWLAPDRDPREVARAWQRAGTSLVVVTHGAEGSFAVTSSGEVEAEPERVEVVDTVGAGDAFTSGLLAWLREEDLLTVDRLAGLEAEAAGAALSFAGRVAGLTCGRPGADPPRRRELDDQAR